MSITGAIVHMAVFNEIIVGGRSNNTFLLSIVSCMIYWTSSFKDQLKPTRFLTDCNNIRPWYGFKSRRQQLEELHQVKYVPWGAIDAWLDYSKISIRWRSRQKNLYNVQLIDPWTVNWKRFAPIIKIFMFKFGFYLGHVIVKVLWFLI